MIPITATARREPEVIWDLLESCHPVFEAFGIGIKDNAWVASGCLKPGVEVDLVEEVATDVNTNVSRVYRKRSADQINHAFKRRVLVAQQVCVVLPELAKGRVGCLHHGGVAAETAISVDKLSCLEVNLSQALKSAWASMAGQKTEVIDTFGKFGVAVAEG